MRSIGYSILLFCCLAACGGSGTDDEDPAGGAAGSGGGRSASGGSVSGGTASGTGGDFYLCEGVPPGTVIQIVVAQAVSEGLCPIEVTVVGAGETLKPSCEARNTSSCACTVDLEEASYKITVEHADGRKGVRDFDYAPPSCGDVEVQVKLDGDLNTDDCGLPCETYEVCPVTFLGQFCIGGCCAVE